MIRTAERKGFRIPTKVYAVGAAAGALMYLHALGQTGVGINESINTQANTEYPSLPETSLAPAQQQVNLFESQMRQQIIDGALNIAVPTELASSYTTIQDQERIISQRTTRVRELQKQSWEFSGDLDNLKIGSRSLFLIEAVGGVVLAAGLAGRAFIRSVKESSQRADQANTIHKSRTDDY